jgi:hypothetical protein
MKNKNCIALLIAISSIFLILFYGCADSLNNMTNPPETGKSDLDDNSAAVFEVEVMPLIIKNIARGTYKEELIKQLGLLKMSEKESLEYIAYTQNKLDILEYFYYPSVEIDGYELYCVEATKYSFQYYYAPKEGQNGEYWFSHDTGILITIQRPEYVDASDPLKILTDQMDRLGMDYIAEDNFLWGKTNSDMTAQLGDVWFMVSVPDKLNEFEFLVKICQEIIDNSELVVVK